MKPEAERPPEEGEEVAHYDDAVIGRAFRLSAVAVVALGVVGGGSFLCLKMKPETQTSQVTKIEKPVVHSFAGVEVLKAKFTEVTAAAGIQFVHNNGVVGVKLLPETMGGGVGFFDYDNNGDQDL